MTALVIVEALALLLLGVLVVGLLRSHAEILQRLHELGAGVDPDADHAHGAHDQGAGAQDLGFPVPPGRALPSARGARPAADLTGETASGEIAHLAVTGTGRDTVIAFLSTGCRTCAGFWDELARTAGDGTGLGLPRGATLLIATRGTEDENIGRVRELAPAGVPVVMSTAAWDAYEVPVAPYFVHVDGSSDTVVGEGAASSWKQVAELLRDATSDRAASAARTGSSGFSRRRFLGAGVLDLSHTDATGSDMNDSDRTVPVGTLPVGTLPVGTAPVVGADAASREARIDAELRAAGIQPGDPSLYLDSDSLYAPER